MSYNVGDRVRIKSLDWYEKNKDEYGYVDCGKCLMNFENSQLCGKIVTISRINDVTGTYKIEEDNGLFFWTDEMIEGLAEEENNDCEKCGLTRNSTRCLFMDNCPNNKQKTIIEIPEDWVLKDENGDEILTSKIILEKKKKEYPKTYEECAEVLGECAIMTHGYKRDVLNALQKLIVCRDAYWKIAGEEMGLGKPWEPDWNEDVRKYCIGVLSNRVQLCDSCIAQYIFSFPTEEMRDTFYENFKKEIEICKELL